MTVLNRLYWPQELQKAATTPIAASNDDPGLVRMTSDPGHGDTSGIGARLGIGYAEDHCALRWPLLAWGLYVPAALVAGAFALALTVSAEWLIAIAFIPGFALIPIGLLYRNWPTAIRIDEYGIRIGAVGSRRADGRRPRVTHQNWGLFSCPWSGVSGLSVVTEPTRIRELRTSAEFYTLSNRWGRPSGMTGCMLGVLTAPFMRSALLIEINPFQATVPETRPASFFPNALGRPFRTKLPGQHGATWLVPTRHPERLREAVINLNAAGLGHAGT
jgi:hypothetical protein